MDATDPSAAPLISEGSKQLTLRFAEPKDAGDIVYATIAPVSLDSSLPVTITATGTLYESEPRTFDGKDFAAGHTTPIAYRIPAQGRILGTLVRLSFKAEDLHLGEQTLGERINSFTLRADGTVFDNGLPERTFTIDPSNTYDILFADYPNDLIGKEITILYDSEHALVSRTFSIGSLTEHQINPLMLPGVPYLFEEDFSGVNGNGYDDNKGTWNGKGNELSGMNLPGWSGQRIGSSAGKAIRVNSRHEKSLGIGADYHGRVTSPALSGLKNSIPVVIRFNSSGSDAAQWQFGTTENTGNVIYTDEDMTAIGPAHSNLEGGSYDRIDTPVEITFTANSATRLSWKISNNRSDNSWISCYVYLDDIRVSIVPDAR